MSLPAGTRLGPYEIVAPLGAGGMGEVYRARDLKLNRDVAVKVLPASVAGDPERLLRFRREAQVLASLNHPHIAQIYGFEDSPPASGGGTTHALVMELVDGATLADLIVTSGALPVEQVIAIARQLADAIEAAHEQGVIHRDLKPANIKIKTDGSVKVLDFGLAKAMDPVGTSGIDATNSPTLTGAMTGMGVILGTAAYMAPEQARGHAVDRRADIWAFGVVLYEMLTGKRPFAGDDVSETLAAVLRDTPAFDALPTSTPAKLKRLVEKCLVRNPKLRLRDIGDARIELDAIASGRTDERDGSAAAGVIAPSATRPRLAALPWIVASAAIVAALFFAWTAMHPAAPQATTVTRFRTTLKGGGLFGALSRDGSRFVYTSLTATGTLNLMVRPLAELDARPLPGGEGAAFAKFSPDGQWMAFAASDNHIKRVPVTGGTPTTVAEGTFVNGADWGDDDTIVFSGPKGLLRVAATGGTPQAITTLGPNETAHVQPQFLRDGHRLLFTVVSNSNSSETRQFAVLDLNKGTYRAVAPSGMGGRFVPTGHLTFVRDATLIAVPFDVDRLVVTGPETPVVEGVSTAGPAGTADYTFSDTGVLAYFQGGQGGTTTLSWADRKGVTEPLPGTGSRSWGTGRLSPDGTRIAIGIHDGGNTDVWVMDVVRANPTRLTFGGNNDHPVWSPDGRHIYYGASIDGKYGVWSVSADGSDKPSLVVSTEHPPTVSSTTPDGAAIVYDASVAGHAELFVVDVPPGPGARAARRLHPDATRDEWAATVSPNGRWLAYESSESGAREIYIQPYPGPGAKVRVSTQGGADSRWSHTGRELFFWNVQQPGLMSAAIDDATTLRVGTPQALFPMATGTTWDVMPGDNRFLVETLDTGTGSGSSYVIVTNWFDELRRLAKPKTK